MDSVGNLVKKAQGGSGDAFSDLVRRFQDMALATAVGRLSDLQLAREAAQEAFLRSFELLQQLRDPNAFPGWFKKILLNECNRVQGQLSRERLTARTLGELGGSEVDTEDPDERRVVRNYLEQLPESERAVLALQYLGGYTQSAIAEFLDLSVAGVKKRAFRGRNRVREGTKEMVEKALQDSRPSNNERFGNTIQFFLAIRRGDVHAVKDLLAADSQLASATEVWDDDEARRAGHFRATGATALVRAAGQGRSEIVDLLCSTGADPNVTCGCEGGESPLWAAVASGHFEVAELLVSHKANVNQRAFRGTTPLHVATMRGRADLVELLLEGGADPKAIDDDGRTPAQWAQLKGHQDIAIMLSAKSQDVPAVPERPSPSGAKLMTGIKTLDVFAPVKPGSLVRWIASENLGQLIITAELSHNLATDYGAQTIWIGFETSVIDQDQLGHLVAEASPRANIRSLLAPRSMPLEDKASHFREAVLLTAAACIGQPTVVFVVEAEGYVADVVAALPSLSDALVVFVLSAAPEKGATLKRPYSAIIQLDRRLAQRGIFPAIDPLASRSQLILDSEGSRHGRLAARARSLIGQLLHDGNTMPPMELRQATLLLSALSQAFHSAEPFGGQPAESHSLEETLTEIEAILNM